MKQKNRGNQEYVLAIDFGTQSVRAIIVDDGGKIVAKEKLAYEPYFSAHPGWAEKDSLDYWRSMCRVVEGVRRGNEEIWPELRGVVLSTLRDSAVCVDRDGQALRPVILWLDQRMATGFPDFSMLENMVVNLAGMKQALALFYRKAKSNWIKENEPHIWAKTDKYLQVSGFMNYLLTGKMVDSNAAQIGFIPFDYKKKTWYRKNNLKAKLMPVETSKLPDIVEPGTIIGKVTEKAAAETGLPPGLPVIAGGSDKGCETLGVGCLDESMGSISLGTTATIQTTARRYYEAIKFLPPYPAVVPGCYNPEVQIFRGYWLVSWFKNEFSKKEVLDAEKMNVAPEVLLNTKLDSVPPGCHGLLLHPMWSPGILTPTAKGSLIGFGDVHTHAHVYRAIIEGVSFALYEGLEKIEKRSGQKMKEVAIAGGGSQSDAICQITADIMNLPVKRVHTYEASGLGAAIIGMVGTGVYPSFEEAIRNMVHYTDTFIPRAENVNIYRQLYRDVFTRIFPRLKDLYDNIQRITGYPQL